MSNNYCIFRILECATNYMEKVAKDESRYSDFIVTVENCLYTANLLLEAPEGFEISDYVKEEEFELATVLETIWKNLEKK